MTASQLSCYFSGYVDYRYLVVFLQVYDPEDRFMCHVVTLHVHYSTSAIIIDPIDRVASDRTTAIILCHYKFFGYIMFGSDGWSINIHFHVMIMISLGRNIIY